MKWLDDEPLESVIFVCFGKMRGFEPPQLAEIAKGLENRGKDPPQLAEIVKALENSGQSFL